MQNKFLGQLENISRLSLGGGGIGQVWGETSRDEAIATVHESYEAGINLFDMAPMYGNGEAESVMGLAFGGGRGREKKLRCAAWLQRKRQADGRCLSQSIAAPTRVRGQGWSGASP